MIATRKSLIAMSGLIAVGLFAAINIAQSRTSEASPAATVSARFPGATETLVVHNIGRTAPQETVSVAKPAKAERTAPASCTHEHWPYVADECLVSTEGARPSPPSRVIRIERRVATNKLIAVQ
jgi:hypothetical protein